MTDKEIQVKINEFHSQLSEFGIDQKELMREGSNSVFMALNLPTPKKFIKQRPAKGGGKWDYVEGVYVIDRLNMIFGLAWSFEVDNRWTDRDFAFCSGHLVILLPGGRSVKRPGMGGHPITYMTEPVKDQKTGEIVGKKKTSTLLDLTNDYNAAETQGLKRAARLLGIGLDLYSDELQSERRLLAAAARRESSVGAKARAAAEAAKNNVLGEAK